MPKYVCIKACVWHHPDFATPRYLEPDGGKTVYVLKEGAPAHIFRRIDEPEPQVQRPAGPVTELGIGLRSARAMFLELVAKERPELEKLAAAVELGDPAIYLDNISLVKAILKHAGYIESSAAQREAGGRAAGQPAPSSIVDLKAGSAEAERALGSEGQPLTEPAADPEEREMDQLLQERAKEPKPEQAEEADPHNKLGSIQVELLNKSRKELNEIAKGYHVADPEKAANKAELVSAIMQAAGYQLPEEKPGA